jgi:hypothetical protein
LYDVRSVDFWRVYFGCQGVDGEVPSWESLGRDEDVFFDLPCGPRYGLRVEGTIGYWSITLLLVDLASGDTHQLGWWDDAQWHPYALRWAELMQLEQHWLASCCESTTIAERLLLLSPFVGLPAVEDLAQRQQVLVRALSTLGIREEGAVASLIDRALQTVSGDDYAWTFSPELGWLFGGEYPCYSIRNLDHRGDSEPRFPFEHFDKLLSDIGF